MENLKSEARLSEEEVAQRNEKMLSKVADFYRNELKGLGRLTDKEIRNSKEMVMKLIRERLTDAEKEIIFLMYGIKDGIVRTFEDTAKVFGLTSEQVEEIDRVAFVKIRPSCSYEESIWKKINPTILPSKNNLEKTKQVIEEFVKSLTVLEQKIFNLRECGADGEPMMLSDVGEVFKMSARKVACIEMRVHRKIEKYCLRVIKIKRIM